MQTIVTHEVIPASVVATTSPRGQGVLIYDELGRLWIPNGSGGHIMAAGGSGSGSSTGILDPFNTATDYPDGSLADVVAGLYAQVQAYAKNLIGTPNQIDVNITGSDITLSTPQATAATATPTFAGMTLTGPLAVKGLTDATVVAAGNIGETLLPARVLAGSAVALTSGSNLAIVTQAVQQGRYLVFGDIGFTATGTIANLSCSYCAGAISQVASAFPTSDESFNWLGKSSTFASDPHFTCPPRLITVSAAGSLYLVARALWTGSSVGISAYGGLSAIRIT